jgi:CheY-like chemotaxis protein
VTHYLGTGGRTIQAMNSRSYLERRSLLAKQLANRQAFERVCIIDDRALDADVLAGLLRRILGRDLNIEIAKSILTLHTSWATVRPDLVFLDDRLGHLGTASMHIPTLRRLGYNGPIVIISGMMSRQRRAEMIGAGAVEALHKDDVDALVMMDLLLRLLGPAQAPPTVAP